MIADVFTTTGKKSHYRACEDYAGCGNGVIPYVVVCDGCSNAPDSRVGAVLLALAARRNLFRLSCVEDERNFATATLHTALSFCRTVGMDPVCLNSTVLVATQVEDTIKTMMYGDGCFAARSLDGGLTVVSSRFLCGAPYYLMYERSREAKDAYFKEFGPDVQVEVTSERIRDGQVVTKTVGVIALAPDRPYFTASWSPDQYSEVAVLTDGIHSVCHGRRPVPFEQVVCPLMEFHDCHPGFVRKRGEQVSNLLEENGWINHDDISYGVLCGPTSPTPTDSRIGR